MNLTSEDRRLVEELCQQHCVSGPIPRGCVGLPKNVMALSIWMLSGIPNRFHMAQNPSRMSWPALVRDE